MRLLAPLRSRATYRGWLWLILGGALMMPYMMVGGVVYGGLYPEQSLGGTNGITHPLVYLAVLPVVAATSLLIPDLEFERTAARRLLGADFESPQAEGTWNARWRSGLWFTLHAAIGSVLSGITLAVVPFVCYAAARSFMPVGDDWLASWWPVRWGVPLGAAMLVALVLTVAAAAELMCRIAPGLLGPGAADRLAASRAETARLAARNRIARELHDSVGHALSVVVVQSDAAARVIGADPDFAAKAMRDVGETARSALAELDAVIGALREDGRPSRAPDRDLADLGSLAAESGVDVDLVVDGDPEAVGRLASREIYRIVQEALTNVLRHADRTEARVEVGIGAGLVRVAVDSPAARAPRRTGGGRGLIGMDERAAVLGGTAGAAHADGRWRVEAAVPLDTASGRGDDD